VLLNILLKQARYENVVRAFRIDQQAYSGGRIFTNDCGHKWNLEIELYHVCRYA
jgi:hypothetical protein